MGKGAQRVETDSRDAAADVLLLARTTLLSTEEAEAFVEKKTALKHPHSERRKEILHAHPEVAALFGPHRGTAGWTCALVGFQLVSAVLLTRHTPWWFTLLFMYSVGAVVDHALWVLIHEATHNLVFKSVRLNRLCLIIANIPHVFPSSMMFRYYHILHHIELNRAHRDPDVPYEWEAELVGNSSLRKSLWLLFFFLVQTLRTAFYTHRIPRGIEIAWFAANWVANFSVCAGLVYAFGWAPLVYLLLASVFCIGLHPLGARWIQEHYPTQPFQATYSYYGWVNRVAFAIGYHVEHHDFPSVPWNKLAALKRAAPEYYDTLFAYTSYSELLRDFIFNRKWSLASRFIVEKEMSANLPPNADAFTRTERTGRRASELKIS